VRTPKKEAQLIGKADNKKEKRVIKLMRGSQLSIKYLLDAAACALEKSKERRRNSLLESQPLQLLKKKFTLKPTNARALPIVVLHDLIKR
jgi:hypothetical protein